MSYMPSKHSICHTCPRNNVMSGVEECHGMTWLIVISASVQSQKTVAAIQAHCNNSKSIMRMSRSSFATHSCHSYATATTKGCLVVVAIVALLMLIYDTLSHCMRTTPAIGLYMVYSVSLLWWDTCVVGILLRDGERRISFRFISDYFF